MILVLSHVRHVVRFLVHVLIVEELIGDESALCGKCSPVWCRSVTVKAEVLTLSHPVNNLLSYELAYISVAFLVQDDPNDLGAYWRALSLVLHESAHTTLLVPDEEILFSLAGIVDRDFELL